MALARVYMNAELAAVAANARADPALSIESNYISSLRRVVTNALYGADPKYPLVFAQDMSLLFLERPK